MEKNYYAFVLILGGSAYGWGSTRDEAAANALANVLSDWDRVADVWDREIYINCLPADDWDRIIIDHRGPRVALGEGLYLPRNVPYYCEARTPQRPKGREVGLVKARGIAEQAVAAGEWHNLEQ